MQKLNLDKEDEDDETMSEVYQGADFEKGVIVALSIAMEMYLLIDCRIF